ncbi:MAG: DUF2842 domain-containing protein [Pseudomonadota bacterium]
MKFLLDIPIGARKFIGIFLLVPFLFIYAMFAMALGVKILPEYGTLERVVYYFIAGLAWLPVAMGIIWFMQKKKV